MKTVTDKPVLTTELRRIVETVNRYHAQIVQSARESLDAAIEIGGWLFRVKESLPYGQFESFVADSDESVHPFRFMPNTSPTNPYSYRSEATLRLCG